MTRTNTPTATVAGTSRRCFVLSCPNVPEGNKWFCPAHEASIKRAAARAAAARRPKALPRTVRSNLSKAIT